MMRIKRRRRATSPNRFKASKTSSTISPSKINYKIVRAAGHRLQRPVAFHKDSKTTNKIMKTIIPLLAVMFLVGCGNNNSTNQSSSTNSASSEPPASSGSASMANTNSSMASPSTNDVMTNSPAGEMTNAPAVINEAATNTPATTNQ